MEWIKQHGLHERNRDRKAFEELPIQLQHSSGRR